MLEIPIAAHSIGALGIFSAEGDDWKQDTKLVRPAFNRANVQEYLCIFNDMAGRLVEKWGKEITAKGGGSSHDNDGIISINRDLTNLTADNIGKTSTDTDFDFLHNPDKGMAADVIDTQQAGVYRTFRPFPYWKIPIIGQYLDLYGFCLRRLHKEFRAVVNEYEAQLMKEDDEQGDGGSSSGSNSIGRRKTFMAKLFEVMKTQKTQMSSERVIGNILTLFIAGSDTTSKTLVDALYLIAQDPLLQQELAAEAVAFFANTKEERFTLDEMHEQSPRIKSFLHEVHRLYGVPFMLMQASEEVSVGGQTIQPGQSMILLWRYIAKRNPRCPMGPAGEMADEFCGRRFLVCQETNETGKTILTCPPPDPSVVMGFGGGMRSCPGRTYAESVQQVVLLRLLQNFSFKVAPNHPPTEDIFEVVILPDKPIQLQVTKR
jgi:cytochrome P450